MRSDTGTGIIKDPNDAAFTNVGWVLTDHLASIRMIVDAAPSSTPITTLLYYTTGSFPTQTVGALVTNYSFTGQCVPG